MREREKKREREIETERERDRKRKRERERERESYLQKNKIGGCWTSKAMGTINNENIKQS